MHTYVAGHVIAPVLARTHTYLAGNTTNANRTTPNKCKVLSGSEQKGELAASRVLFSHRAA
jgi:hypothetical protein